MQGLFPDRFASSKEITSFARFDFINCKSGQYHKASIKKYVPCRCQAYRDILLSKKET